MISDMLTAADILSEDADAIILAKKVLMRSQQNTFGKSKGASPMLIETEATLPVPGS